jgi:tetratricopeptide (TPR) repeat protein
MDVELERTPHQSSVLPPQASGHIHTPNTFGGNVFCMPGGGEPFEGQSPAPSPALERYKQMEELELTQKLDNFQSKHGPYHPATINTAMRLGGILSDQGRYRAAELLFNQCADCLQRTFGENNPGTLFAFGKLAHCFVQQGKLSKAEKLFRAVHSKASQILPSSDRMFLLVKMEYSNCIALLGDSKGAERELREILTIGGAVLPFDDPIFLGCMRYLADVLKV